MQLYLSKPEHCGYLPDRLALNLYADPYRTPQPHEYALLLQTGFRRSGEYVYRPHCQSCDACIATRIPVARFTPNRSQRRNAQQNADLVVRTQPAGFVSEHYDLYMAYQAARHPGGSMSQVSESDYLSFLTSSWSNTEFAAFYDGQQLLAVSVYDLTATAMSAVYCFYAPQALDRGLGKFAILWQIREANRRGLEYLYLGYWIKACAKMRYKSDYRPLEIYRNESWQSSAAE